MNKIRKTPQERRRFETREIPSHSLRILQGLPHEPEAEQIRNALFFLSKVEGFIGSSLFDSASGVILGSKGGNRDFNLEVATAGSAEIVRAEQKTISDLGLEDSIQDILISTRRQYHLIRPLSSQASLFLYLVIDTEGSNLAMARRLLAQAEQQLTI